MVCVILKKICFVSLLFSSSSLFFFLYHGQYLGFFEKFRKEEGEERARESFILVEHRREKN